MDTILRDLCYAVRNLLQARGFSVVAILTLALGIGATTAMFTVVNSVLLRPLPYPEPQRLVAVNGYNTHHVRPAIGEGNISLPDYHDIVHRNRTLESFAAYSGSQFTVTGLGEAMQVPTLMSTYNFFQVLGVVPALGRSFAPDDDLAGHHAVIISDRFWREHFNADKNVLGRTFQIEGRLYNVIGVMPPGFQFAGRMKPRDLWITYSRWADASAEGCIIQRGCHSSFGIARMKPGVTVEQTNADLAAVAHGLTSEYPDNDAHTGFVVTPELSYIAGSSRMPLLILMGAVSLVLLIACANVANLLLTRATTRSREIAVRAALGATRMRVVRQLVSESAVLAVAGAVLGAAIANWAVAGMLKLYPDNLPRAADIGIDYRVLLFTAALAISAGVLAGLMPALRVSAPNLADSMREGGRSSTSGVAHARVRSVLVVAQTALGVMLLIGAGLLIRSLERLSRVDLGFNPNHLLTADFDLNETRYNNDQMAHFVDDFVARVAALPGVTAATGSMPLPLGGDDFWDVGFNVLDHPLPKGQWPSEIPYLVSTDYFQTMQVPLVHGRFFDQRDQRNSTPVMIISQAFAKKYFPKEDPLGRKIELGGGEPARKQYDTREIVGVVGDIRTSDLARSPQPAYYVPIAQMMWGPPTLIVRTAGDPEALAPALKNVIHSLDPESPLHNIRTMDDCLGFDLGRARFQTVLLGIFAAIALLLTAIGLYGVVAYSVAQRTHEIGVRMALGASRSHVLAMVLNRGAQLTLAGVTIGVVGALALARVLQALLYETAPHDPATYLLVCLTLALVALAASYLPALRASRVDPMVALRQE
ncbi:MAG TPA: ABC transporter permease [Terriglobales bacterium]|nr:ABC transporter permease [Terriglobales bacterium]